MKILGLLRASLFVLMQCLLQSMMTYLSLEGHVRANAALSDFLLALVAWCVFLHAFTFSLSGSLYVW